VVFFTVVYMRFIVYIVLLCILSFIVYFESVHGSSWLVHGSSWLVHVVILCVLSSYLYEWCSYVYVMYRMY
jgi:hypothetical protein